MPINWGLTKALGRKYLGPSAMKAAWSSNFGRGIIGGAGMGLAYGMFSDNGSVVGSILRGAATGALFGSSRGWGSVATLAGAGLSTAMGYSPLWGATAGRFGAGPGRRTARAMYGGFRAGRRKGLGVLGAMGSAGQAGYISAQRQGRAAASFIGSTAKRAVNPIRGIFT